MTDDAARWDARYAAGDAPIEPSGFVVAQADRLPVTGTALDVAGGAGRHAIWLARRGLDVTLVDVSAEGLRVAARRAREAGRDLQVRQRDLQRESLPAGPFDVVLVHAFLDHDVLDQVPAVLAPGGWFLFAQATVTNLERWSRPPRRFLLERGEMGRIADRLGLQVVELIEGWTPEGRHEAHLVARRSGCAPNWTGRPATAPMRW